MVSIVQIVCLNVNFIPEHKILQASEKKVVKVQADDPIAFAQLINKNELGATEVKQLQQRFMLF